MPSVTAYWGDASYGIKIAYNRDLNTNDLQDVRLYENSIIQVCFISSMQTFVGGGYEKGNTKVCSFLALQSALNQYQDRLLGNYAATTNLGGANLTIYATQSSDAAATESWMFMGIVHKQQGLTPFTGRWIGVTYVNSLTNTDFTVLEYGYRNFLFQTNIMDMYMVNSTFANQDVNFTVNQGSTDTFLNLGGASTSLYMVGLFKRKFVTGDINRDINVAAGSNTFCFFLGSSWAYSGNTYD